MNNYWEKLPSATPELPLLVLNIPKGRNQVSLTAKVASGVKWSTITLVGKQILAMSNKIILAHMLPASAYGLLGMATVIIGFVEIFADLGTASAIIQRKEITDDLMSSVFWMNILLGLLITGALTGIAPFAASFFQEPQVTIIVSILSFSFLLSSFSIVQRAVLRRQMAFKSLAGIELTSVILSVIVGIAMAIAGAGVWSLVVATLTDTAAETILLWLISPWRPRLHLDWNELYYIASFSINLSGVNTLNYFVMNADNLLVGRFLGAMALGYYTLSYAIILVPVQRFAWALGRVFLPTFALIQNDNDRFRRAYLRLCGVIVAVWFPLMLGMTCTADLLVIVVLGPKWMTIVSLLILLAPISMIQSVSITLNQIYMAKGRTDLMFRWGLVTGFVSIWAFFAGLPWGVNGVATGYLIANLLIVYPSLAIPFRLIELPVRDLVRVIYPAFKYTLFMTTTIILLRLILLHLGILSSWIVLVGVILFGVTVYLGLLLLYKPPIVHDLVGVLPLNHFPGLRWLVCRLGLSYKHSTE